MDLTLFVTLLKNLLHSGVRSISGDKDELLGFEEKFCYNAKLQPLFTADALSRLFADVEGHVLYEINDAIGICAVFFRFDQTIFLVGPFVRTEFEEKKVRSP